MSCRNAAKQVEDIIPAIGRSRSQSLGSVKGSLELYTSLREA